MILILVISPKVFVPAAETLIVEAFTTCLLVGVSKKESRFEILSNTSVVTIRNVVNARVVGILLAFLPREEIGM